MFLAHTDAKSGGTCQSCSHRIQSLQVPQETQRLTQNPFEVPNVLEAYTDTSWLTVPLPCSGITQKSQVALLLKAHTDTKSTGVAPNSHTGLVRCSPLETLNTQPVLAV